MYMNIEQLAQIANIDFSKFNPNENNVKHSIVIPFVQAFGHKDLDLEHYSQGTRFDIKIGGKILVEIKALKENLDKHVEQVKRYCDDARPLIAILTNGREFRIYSPQWRLPKFETFNDYIIYEFSITDLNDIEFVKKIADILCFFTSDDCEFDEHIQKREKEILKYRREIDSILLNQSQQADVVKDEIAELEIQIEKFQEQIKLKRQAISNLNSINLPEIEEINKTYYLPSKKRPQISSKSLILKPLPTQTAKEEKKSLEREATAKTDNGLKIGNRKDGDLAKGCLLPNGSFRVLKGSLISNSVAPQFQMNAPLAYKLRWTYENDETIVNRKFTKDVDFNSISLAAKVILGGSFDGKQWIPE